MEYFFKFLTDFLPVLSTIAVAWLGYNQYSKNKQTDYKLETMQKDDEEKRNILGDNIARVYGELHRCLNELKCDRVFIIQPHPLKRYDFISVRFDVHRSGISDIREILVDISISSVVNIVDQFSKNSWLFFTSFTQVSDRRARALMQMGGGTSFAFIRLSNEDDLWVGTLAVENTTSELLDEALSKDVMGKAASVIQFILPPILN